MTSDADMFLEAAGRLKESVRQGRSFEAAQIKVIGLEDIRRAAGESWPQIAARVRTNSKSFIEGCVGQEDIVLPAGDGFLIIYGQAPGRDLDRESAALQDMLNAFYLGERETAALRARIERKAIDARQMAALMSDASQPMPVPRPQVTPPLVSTNVRTKIWIACDFLDGIGTLASLRPASICSRASSTVRATSLHFSSSLFMKAIRN
jgi:hypothetical protein